MLAAMDAQSFLGIVAATFGGALSQSLLSRYFKRKAERTEIQMVLNRRGKYEDIANRFERRAAAGYVVFVIVSLSAAIWYVSHLRL